jgi:oxygen-independent coproporphyrinogen-3 oxidase
MPASLYAGGQLELKRRHFINSYPPFNVAHHVDGDALAARTDLSLYVHIPFCPTICTYCFYKKFGNPSADTVDTYLAALKREIALFAARPEVATRRVKTLYFGGGTPTVLTSEQLTDLVDDLRTHLDLETVEEFCCEMMPDAATAPPEKLATLKALGVTRLSFGVETFNEELLKRHNRPCSRELYDSTYAAARALGFEKINIDVMCGLAGATWESWTEDVETLLAWASPGVSIYKTEVFYNTTMFALMRSGKPSAPLLTDDEEIEHIRYAHDTLQQRGGYLVANCLQLLKGWEYRDEHYGAIWSGTELKGLGLSAHSSYAGVLHQNASELDEYYRELDAGRLPIKRAHRLSARDRVSQAIVYGLKTLAVNRERFIEQFGVDVTTLYGPLITRLEADGIVTLDDEWLRITPRYYIFTDDVCRLFFLPEYERMMLAHVDRDAPSRAVLLKTV